MKPFEGWRVLVTGGTGSLGQTLVRNLLAGAYGTPARVVVFSRDECKQHEMRLRYLERRAATDEVTFGNFSRALSFRIGDVRCYADVAAALDGIDIVINAAALKQVPSCEYFPEQAINTNCLGPANIVRAIRERRLRVQAVVGISTDKACKPVNVMGMSKALQERIFIGANVGSETRFVCVRYGNVIASRGSVVPLFLEQIERGGPVTITTPEMTRFLMTLDEAVATVATAVETARRGEIVISRAPSARVVDVAQALIGDRDIPLRFTGIRPGEKLHEILVSEEERTRAGWRDGYCHVAPALPELGAAQAAGIDGELSSATDPLSLEETARLLAARGYIKPRAAAAA